MCPHRRNGAGRKSLPRVQLSLNVPGMKRLLVYIFAVFGAFSALSAKPIDAKLDESLRDRICPQPKELEFFEGITVLERGSPLSVSTENALSDAEKALIDSFVNNIAG